jgi:hypothetical protein
MRISLQLTIRGDTCQRRPISCGVDINYLDCEALGLIPLRLRRIFVKITCYQYPAPWGGVIYSIKIFFPATKGWKKAAGKIKLDDGVIKQTGTQPLHHSFWISPKKRENFNELFKVI